jgi:hypothetical protein
MSMLRWPRVAREAPQQKEPTLFEAPLESKKAKLRTKTWKQKRPTLNVQHRIQTHTANSGDGVSTGRFSFYLSI